ncbi:hypothetical protein [Marinomonas sp. 2405UD68-3]|uniref:hypothetical protein n=1 Tax=Marinomonas sp. 2405UD68-3 TaxID=3391835 RepID=UPI0039C9AD57
MNSHRKLAIFVVPFLLIGGFIASDFYIEYQADKAKVFQLLPFEECDVINQKCILKSGELEMNVYDKDGLTKIHSSFPLDSVTLFLVGKKESIETYPLGMKESAYY